MEPIAHAVAIALLALVPHLGHDRAKSYGDVVARYSLESRVDPWVVVAVARVETNWNDSNLGDCCGGLMSIHWPGWERYALRHGLPTDRASLRALAQDGPLSLRLATTALATWRRNCGPRPSRYLGAYQSGSCRSNAYGRRVARVASRYRQRFEPVRRRLARVPVRREALAAATFTFGEPGAPPGPTTRATVAAGP